MRNRERGINWSKRKERKKERRKVRADATMAV